MTRDTGRAAVYSAEQLVRAMLDRSGANPTVEIHGSTLVLEPERKFGTLAAAQVYVNAVQASDWYRQRYPRVGPIAVRQRKGNGMAHYDRRANTIAVHHTEVAGAAWSMREFVLLHEMAHAASTGSHGAAFREAFVTHVREVIGETVGFLLATVFAEECEKTSSP